MRIVRLSEIPEEGVSHNPEIAKRVLLRNGAVPHLTTFAQARFAPGQTCDAHAHPTMYEVYLVESGSGEIRIGEHRHRLEPGLCVVVEPGELHSVSNAGREDLVLTYFGIAATDAVGA